MIDVTKRLQELIEAWTPELRKAFLDAIAAMGASVDLNRLVAELAKGDIDAAVREVNLDPLQFRGFETVMTAAYDAGGNDAVAQLPPVRGPAGHKLLVLFDGRNERAERWIRNQSSTLVREVTADQQVAIRQHLEAGLAAGLNPRTVALSLVGTINPKTRKREGGVLGLTSTQEKWARGYEEELKSGDRAFLKRAMRDRRFDATVLKAIKAGKPLSPQQIATMVAAYRARALKYRADTLARTEAISALNQSQMESMQQAVDSGKVQQRYITKTWHSAGDHRVRLTHRMLNGTRVPFATKFTSESGAKLAYPGDPTAPAGERINCFHPSTLIGLVGLQRVIVRNYSGPMVKLFLTNNVNLTVTPNHPVLTQRGWIAAGDVVEADNLLDCSGAISFVIKPQMNNVDSRAEDLYSLAKLSGETYRATSGAVNLHGEIVDHDVDIITFPRKLRDAFKSQSLQVFNDVKLADTDVATGILLYNRLCVSRCLQNRLTASGVMGGCAQLFALIRRAFGKPQQISLATAPYGQVQVLQTIDHQTPANIEISGDCHCRRPLVVERGYSVQENLSSALSAFADKLRLKGLYLDIVQRLQTKVIKARANNTPPVSGSFRHDANRKTLCVHGLNNGQEGLSLFRPVRVLRSCREHYEGPVYNFETDNGLIVANGLVTHNCRCWLQIKVDYIAMLADAEAA